MTLMHILTTNTPKSIRNYQKKPLANTALAQTKFPTQNVRKAGENFEPKKSIKRINELGRKF